MSRPHVTLELLWEEYRQEHPEGLCRSSFYRQYANHCNDLPVSMKAIHKGGEKLFVDYSGKKPRYYDRESGQWTEAEFFVASWGGACYCKAAMTQSGQDWVASHVRALEYFGCAPGAIVPDNLKSGVTKANFYEPDINTLYEKFAGHYYKVILPALLLLPKVFIRGTQRFSIAEKIINENDQTVYKGDLLTDHRSDTFMKNPRRLIEGTDLNTIAAVHTILGPKRKTLLWIYVPLQHTGMIGYRRSRRGLFVK